MQGPGRDAASEARGWTQRDPGGPGLAAQQGRTLGDNTMACTAGPCALDGRGRRAVSIHCGPL
eukprot:5483552-Alexandrium_andersonii.AAC.1